jgi:predicted TIM-barrel fold metal-dependent hydrolase
MIIDFHTHMFPDKIAEKTIAGLAGTFEVHPSHNGTSEGLKLSAANAGIDLSIALPIVTKPSQFTSITKFAEGFREAPILSFGSVHPESADIRGKLTTLANEGFLGIKLHPDYQNTYFNDINYKRIVDIASELGLIVVVHAGWDPLSPEDVHATPEMIKEVITEVKPTKLVLAHLGSYARWNQVEELIVGEDVYLDTAVVLGDVPKEQLLRIIKNHGEDRILFATDSPWAPQDKFVTYMKDLEQSREIGEGTYKKIMGDNAVKLLGL